MLFVEVHFRYPILTRTATNYASIDAFRMYDIHFYRELIGKFIIVKVSLFK